MGQHLAITELKKLSQRDHMNDESQSRIAIAWALVYWADTISEIVDKFIELEKGDD